MTWWRLAGVIQTASGRARATRCERQRCNESEAERARHRGLAAKVIGERRDGDTMTLIQRKAWQVGDGMAGSRSE
jgi:hypothetical protein